MAMHSSILAWRIPWTEEPGGLQSMGSQKTGHSWTTKQQHTLWWWLHNPINVYTKNHLIVPSKWMNGMLHELYLSAVALRMYKYLWIHMGEGIQKVQIKKTKKYRFLLLSPSQSPPCSLLPIPCSFPDSIRGISVLCEEDRWLHPSFLKIWASPPDSCYWDSDILVRCPLGRAQVNRMLILSSVGTNIVLVCEVTSVMWGSVTPWPAAHQAPPSLGLSSQEYWRRLPCPSPGDLSGPGMEPPSRTSPALGGRFFTTSATWEALFQH